VDLDIRQNGNICTLKLKGPFKSVESVKELNSAVESALAGGCIYIILDLSEMPYIDSAGIGAIVSTLRQTRQLGGHTMLINPSPFAEKTFKMVGILSLFGVHTSEEDAVAACESK
jgi:anti-sigma B factor antagonist